MTGAVQDFHGVKVGKVFLNNRYGSVQEWLDGHVSIHQPGCLWSYDTWQSCGPFREDLQFVFDRYYFTLCRIKGIRLLSSGITLAGFRLHDESKTVRYQYSEDRFTPEWLKSKKELERILSPFQRLCVWFARNLEENWRLVSAALQVQGAESEASALMCKVSRNPLWLLHRPVASALLRLSARRVMGAFK